MTHPFTAVVAALGWVCASFATGAETVNGFKLTDLRVERAAIKSGGPPRDGIPSIDDPKFVTPAKADFMKDDDLVLSFTEGTTTRAYPLRILVWHEIVNETIAGRPILVTYCPLCGTAMIFNRKVAGEIRTFGVSGLLYQSDVLMYDRQSESLWSQLKMESVSGPLSGKELELLPSAHLTWKAWKKKHPDGGVLSAATGHERNYRGDAYASYFASPNTMFPVPRKRDELLDKAWVVGVIVAGKPVAFPVSRLEKTREASHDGVRLKYDPESRLATASDAAGKEIPTVTVFWFAWQAFYPQTTLWKP
jgi:hypothetical protein